MPRNLENWIHAYMEFTRETESPEAYHFWTSACILGAATARQVSLNFNYFTIYPNFFTILVGPSGARKSAATNIGIKLAEAVGIKRFSDKITGAALIRDLSDATKKNIQGTNIALCSPMLIYASELGVFMGPDAYGSGVIADLTDLYDCPSKWEKKTIARNAEEIIAPYVSMLAASTPQTLKDVIPTGAVGQGFTSRILFVWGAGRRQRVPIPSWGVEYEMLEKMLVADLRHIATLRGTFDFTPAGFDSYKRHYLSRPEPEEEFEDERLRGYASRKDIHLLKLAMVLSLADRDDLKIDEKEVAAAIEAFNWLDEGLPSVFSGHGTATSSMDVVRIYEQITKASRKGGYITLGELVKKNYNHANHDAITMVIATLRESKAIQEIIKPDADGIMTRCFRVLDHDFIKRARTNLPRGLRTEDKD